MGGVSRLGRASGGNVSLARSAFLTISASSRASGPASSWRLRLTRAAVGPAVISPSTHLALARRSLIWARSSGESSLRMIVKFTARCAEVITAGPCEPVRFPALAASSIRAAAALPGCFKAKWPRTSSQFGRSPRRAIVLGRGGRTRRPEDHVTRNASQGHRYDSDWRAWPAQWHRLWRGSRAAVPARARLVGQCFGSAALRAHVRCFPLPKGERPHPHEAQ